MYKKDYVAIGNIIRHSFAGHHEVNPLVLDIHMGLVDNLCDLFEANNSNFDRDKFVEFVYRDFNL